MAIGYTTILKLPLATQGTQTWATWVHRALNILDGGVYTVTKAAGATVLADASGANDAGKKPVIRGSITLTATVLVGVPAKHRVFLAENFTGGTSRWKIQTASNGIGVVVPKNRRMWLRSTTTGVLPASRLDGRATATELGVGVITATHFAAGAITNAALATGAVGLTKIAGGASYGRLLYTASTAGFAWTTLARGTPDQVLAMSTAATPKPAWRTPPVRRIATSTQMSIAAGDTKTFTHGITGIANKYDYALIQPILVCVGTDAGFAVGDCLYGPFTAGDTHSGLDVYADSTTSVKVDITTSTFAYLNKSTQAVAVLTLSDWRLIVKVIA